MIAPQVDPLAYAYRWVALAVIFLAAAESCR